MTRIISGLAGGRRIHTLPGGETRPTSDRVREALFSRLEHLDVVLNANVLDLYAGSGALGLEALSRGAAHAVFVERNPRALRALEQNIDGTGTDRAAVTVVRADAVDWLARRVGNESFDIALLDPSYDFAAWPDLLAVLPATLAVIESNRDITDEIAAAAWEIVRHRRYGAPVLTIVCRLPPA